MSAAAPEPEVSEKCLRSTGPAGGGERRERRGKRVERDLQEDLHLVFVIVNKSHDKTKTNCVSVRLSRRDFPSFPLALSLRLKM